MKKAVFNPDEWNAAVASSARHTDVEALVCAVEASGIDITAAYPDWLSIGFALVSELGEEGRPLFHRLSRFYPGYDMAEADRQYTVCLRDGSREISIATLFHIAKTHGIVIPVSSRNRCEEVEEDEENEETGRPKPVKTDTFSQTVGGQLPDILKRIVADAVSPVDADLLILGSLTVFSACLPNVYGVYDRREVFSNLFLYVTASASAGKGRLSLCRHLAAPLHRELREQYRKSMERYKQEQLQYVLNKKKGEASEPEEPPFLTLFIPANSTATVVYQTLSQNNGVGLLFETEGDTLANAFNSDLGNYSDGFRKAFHHETISYLRKKDREYVEITKPKFSAILSGTPEQVFNLIPSAENGLFSRFIFYVMPTEIVWHDMFDASEGPTADELFKEIGRDFYQFHKLLGAQLFRFAMILTVLRQMDEGAFPLALEDGKEALLVCTDADFDTALAMVKVLLQHTVRVFQALPRRTERRFRQDRRQRTESYMQTFLAALPEAFSRSGYLQTAADMGINEKTAERYIAELCRSGMLEHPASGQYVKPS